jgi:hypothetical protein
MQHQLPLDGWCNGPLFQPVVKRRAPKPHNGLARVRKVRSRVPPWASAWQIRMFYAVAAQRRCVTGTEWSVDHLVPIEHPLVCGLHCASNLQVVPLLDNIRKSNNWWPDMWGPQDEMFEGGGPCT